MRYQTISVKTAKVSDIAGAIGVSRQAVHKRAAKENWAAVKCGRGMAYPIQSLPKPIAEAVQIASLYREIEKMPGPSQETLPVPASSENKTSLPAPNTLPASVDTAPSVRQHDIERARERLLAFVDTYPGGMIRAIAHLNASRATGTLPEPLAWAFAHAWDKKPRSEKLSRKTIYNWLEIKSVRGRAIPKKIQPDLSVKPWYELLLSLLKRPQGSCLTWIAKTIKEQWDPAWGDSPPSYHTIRRTAREKLSAIDQLKGRLTGSQLRAHRHWRPRTANGMRPWQEVHADGWATHFTAPHPLTGEYVTFEVWHFHDVATRYVTPPGIGMSETYEVVTSGLERCVRVGGMMSVLMTDSTKIIKNSPRFTSDQMAALAARAGFVTVHPVAVGNSQANGICENFNRWLDQQSRELATYQGAGMDGLTLRRVKKITEKMIKAANVGDLAERARLQAEAERTGKGRVFASYQDAIQWILNVCERWNDKPHRSLPKIADPRTGRQRHQTPREALRAFIDDGWRPVELTEDHLVDLFRPHVRCKVTREAVSPVGNGQRYHFPGLGAWNNSEVLVAVDPMDWRAVWIKTLKGELIGIADLVEATGYRAKSVYELAEEKRAAAQRRRLAQKMDRVQARTGQVLPAPVAEQMVIAGQVVDQDALATVINRVKPEQTRLNQTRSDETDPSHRSSTHIPRSERPAAENYAEWLEIDGRISNGEALSDADILWHRTYPTSAQYRSESKRKAAA
ncbi:MAG: transposase [Candidatus Accumulibacter sp.]|nr:transposase [Accumulibacter sp.]